MDKPANRFYGEQRDIEPGEYGRVEFHGFRKNCADLTCFTLLTADELREAAHLFNQLAEALEGE